MARTPSTGKTTFVIIDLWLGFPLPAKIEVKCEISFDPPPPHPHFWTIQVFPKTSSVEPEKYQLSFRTAPIPQYVVELSRLKDLMASPPQNSVRPIQIRLFFVREDTCCYHVR